MLDRPSADGSRLRLSRYGQCGATVRRHLPAPMESEVNLFFCKRYSVCTECGVHFETVTGYEARWGHLCAVHRKPVMQKDEKRDKVIAWATSHWERLVEQVEKEEAAIRAAYNSTSLSAQQNAYNVGFGQGSSQEQSGFQKEAIRKLFGL